MKADRAQFKVFELRNKVSLILEINATTGSVVSKQPIIPQSLASLGIGLAALGSVLFV
jgi:hypothetical protein